MLGFRTRLPGDNSLDLPSANSYIYALWEVDDSADCKGWYLAKVTSIQTDRLASLHYHKNKTTETINLNEIRWVKACGNGKWFLPSDELVSSCLSKAKAYADGLTVVSSSSRDHCQALLEISKLCADIDLTLKPSKYVSLVYDGERVDKKTTLK